MLPGLRHKLYCEELRRPLEVVRGTEHLLLVLDPLRSVRDLNRLHPAARTHLVEIIELHGGHGASDLGGDGFAGVSDEVRHREESGGGGGVRWGLDVEVPEEKRRDVQVKRAETSDSDSHITTRK